MKTLRSCRRAFTFIEMSVSLGVMAITGTILFSAIRSVSLLGAKNSAINLTHQQSREVIHRAVQQIHSSVAIPSMASASLAAQAGNGPAAGVTFQTLVSGPNRVWTSVTANANTIRIAVRSGDPVPQAGMRLILPAFRVEEDITGVATVAGTPTTYTLTLANPITSAITCNNGTPNYLAYVTQRSGLVVVNGELRHYPRISAGTYTTVATNITTPTPFSVPAGDNRFVQADFATRDARITGLNLKSMDTKLQLTVPYRYRLTTRQ